MIAYKHMSENGTITSRIEDFEWRSLCHNEGLMDEWSMFIETDGLGWSVCRLCGKQAHFIKRWPK